MKPKDIDLMMFFFMGFKPESHTPWYADSAQYSLNGHPSPFYPGNFNPSTNWEHLMVVARKLDIEELPTIFEFALQVVKRKVKESVGDIDYRTEIKKHINRQPCPLADEN